MREILFRGKRVNDGVWVHGDLVRITDGDGESSGVFVAESFDEIKKKKPTFKGNTCDLNATAKRQIVSHFYDDKGKRNKKTVAYFGIPKK